MAGVLQQKNDPKQLHVIEYAGKAFADSENKWPLEAYAIVYHILYFKEYLWGRTFTVRTDHENFKWL